MKADVRSLSLTIATACDKVATAYCAHHGRWPEEVWYDLKQKSTPDGGFVVVVHASAGNKAPPPPPGQLRDVLLLGRYNRNVAEA